VTAALGLCLVLSIRTARQSLELPAVPPGTPALSEEAALSNVPLLLEPLPPPPPPERRNFVPPGAAWTAALGRTQQSLSSLHAPMPPPGMSDWLWEHPEPGQTFRQYLASQPPRPTATRHTVYVQLLGHLTPTQQHIVVQTAEYLHHYFNLRVELREPLPLSVIPAAAFRYHQGARQMHSGTVLEEVLAARLPSDAAAYIAFTAIDLFPASDWNFVFGEGSLKGRVGVWSLARFGDPSRSLDSYQLVLLRTLKTATHELGHMFGIAHCTAHPCNMNGANSLEEGDRWPLQLCPECLAKVLWLTQTDAAAHLGASGKFCTDHGLLQEAERFQRSSTALATATGAK
jgi:archaemetzincin